MKVTIFVVALVSAGLSFAAGFIGGAVLNRPARQDYDSKIEQIRTESEKSEQAIKEKLRQAQGTIQGLEKEIQRLNNELRNMHEALAEANKKVREIQSKPIIANEIKIPKENTESTPSLPTEEFSDSSKKVAINPIFGIRLGESLDTIKRRIPVSQSNYSFLDKDHPGIVWDVHNTDSTIKSLRVSTYQQHIYCISVYFADTSETNFNAIRSSLRDKYKHYSKQGLIDSLYGEYNFVVRIDGIETSIRLNRDISFGDDDALELSYIHNPLITKLHEEVIRRKASRVDDKL